MPDPIQKTQVSKISGRYTITKSKNTNSNKTTTIEFYAKDGTKLKPDYYSAAEAKDLASHNGYDEYYNTKVIQKDGQYYLKVTAKTKQPYGMLAEDYLKKVNDGTIKKYNPKAFEGYNCTDGYGRQMSDLNKKMRPGDSVILPIDKVEIKDSPVGFFRRKIMNGTY